MNFVYFATAVASFIALVHFVCMAAFLRRGCMRFIREIVTLCATASMYVLASSVGHYQDHYVWSLALWLCAAVIFFLYAWHTGCCITKRGVK